MLQFRFDRSKSTQRKIGRIFRSLPLFNLLNSKQSCQRSSKNSPHFEFASLENRQVLSASFPTYINGNFTLGNESGDSPYNLNATFLLESNPDAEKTIYLDFNGHFSINNDWDHAITFPQYNTSGSANSFANSELIEIQRIFQNVAEDFLPFDVNVTTKDPGVDALTRSNGADDEFGVRVLLTQSTAGFGEGTGGIAIRNSFLDRQDTPVFAFNKGVNTAGWTASHEVGHALGLEHDGIGDATYYGGHGTGETSWGPILGGPFGRRLTQWSNGNYEGANNREDDLRVITRGATGVDFRDDAISNSRFNAQELVRESDQLSSWGIIEQRTDVDYFQFTVETSDVTLSVSPQEEFGNLDVLARLYNSSGELIASANPQNELDASITRRLESGTYYLAVDGVGKAGSYDDYGSLGFYQIEGTIDPVAPVVVQTDVIGEASTISFADEHWRTVSLRNQYRDPVVVVGPASRNDGSPAVVRVRNITADSFQVRIQNWDYLAAERESETVSFLVVESGEHTLNDGTVIVAGNGNLGNSTRRIGFGGHFDETPVVFSQITSNNGGSAVTTRVDNVGTGAFEIQMQEEEVNDGLHSVEQFSFVAIEQVTSTSSGMFLETGQVDADHMISSIVFDNRFANSPVLLADLQTFNGADTATVRTVAVTSDAAGIFVEEERSADNEVTHSDETIAFLAINAGDLFGSEGGLDEHHESPLPFASSESAEASPETSPVAVDLIHESSELPTIATDLTEASAEVNTVAADLTPESSTPDDFAIVNEWIRRLDIDSDIWN